MKNIAIFASGTGTNFQAIVDAVKTDKLSAVIKLLVCDRQDAYSIERAIKEKIPSFVFTAKEYASKEEYETEILQRLKELEIDYVVLAGYMRLIGPTLLKNYEGRIINIHPSLLPAFPGKDAIGQALKAKVKESGVSIHFVDEGMDTGPIIAQQSVSLSENETIESLQAKIHEIEHKLYPQVLQRLFTTSQEDNK
ncbi:phosphoribosylglycinamide formyltransferase [Cytobacillus solani]|uniref:Phosphoribosylglycinamide formyltransferase n=1 Tax=Cytobacillus solani TaxID=1637975 RepID=A0A0Q3T2T3_9BACI|nr:phosphoribosylglycinamide formyltransferase [Cytobacillus solani]KOP71301.1 phosphoribosylglycinamide formyltransferase [Bacillus sp. FJAT-21945]KQL17757.1 phosphoribosylglycinamide formyltransferase [Cytobacillus solani]USK55566.1 phosphoribosylglycinamide formyltransferase [Cytobacillus solani]